MRYRPPRILDTSAMIALFAGHPVLSDLLDEAERGMWNLLPPTTCIADAEAELRAESGWQPILLTHGVQSLPLAEHTAIEIGTWPGALAARHAVHEARHIRAAVVTADPGQYRGLPVALLVV